MISFYIKIISIIVMICLFIFIVFFTRCKDGFKSLEYKNSNPIMRHDWFNKNISADPNGEIRINELHITPEIMRGIECTVDQLDNGSTKCASHNKTMPSKLFPRYTTTSKQ